MKILIADDHRLIVEAVSQKLSELAPEVEFVHAFSVPQLLDHLSADIDLAIIDLGMPGARGVDHIAQAHALQPDVRMVVLSGQEDPAIMRAAFDAGASGFIPKAYAPDVMMAAIELVLNGGVYVPPSMESRLGLDDGHQAHSLNAASGMSAAPHDAPQWAARLGHMLTERQMEVMTLLSQGQPNKLIARNLGISEGTVKIHLAAIFRALKVRNRTEAVVAARSVRMA